MTPKFLNHFSNINDTKSKTRKRNLISQKPTNTILRSQLTKTHKNGFSGKQCIFFLQMNFKYFQYNMLLFKFLKD